MDATFDSTPNAKGLIDATLAAGDYNVHPAVDQLALPYPSKPPYHLEFTAHPDHTVPRAPTPDNFLVFYIPDAAAWSLAADRMLALGHNPTPSFNPYWSEHGVTCEDPDGYRVVLQHGDRSK